MTLRLQTPLRVAAVSAAAVVVATTVAGPALADAGGGGKVHVVNTETVQVYTSPTGAVQTRRVYEQLGLTGDGTVRLANPISTDGLRNLDGFGGFTVRDGKQITDTTVHGEKHLRSVSNFDGKLPLDVSVAYKLDGRNVSPGDVVGASGHLDVQYTVTNVTGAPQRLTFADGKGGTVTKTVDVPIPMVGSLTTTTPSSFTNVTSPQANMGGDGQGGTSLSFTMTLFPPIGSATAVFGYSADITDGVVPRASIAALPVNPLQSPTFKTAGDSYKGGADTGVQLAEGAAKIDSNLLKLRDGAGDLVAGLVKLRDGADQLRSGLADQAAPGANRLAAGAAKLADGTGQAAAGSVKLRDGARRLSDGLGTLRSGAGDLNDGAGQISGGQQDLLDGVKLLQKGVVAMPRSVRSQLRKDAQYNALLAGMQAVVDGIGNPNDVTTESTPPDQATLFGALNAIKFGLRNPVPKTDCDKAITGGTPSFCGAMDAVQLVAGLMQQASQSSLPSLVTAAQGVYDDVAGPNSCPDRGSAGFPLAALQSPTAACRQAATVLYGLTAPVGSQVPGLADGGVVAQTGAAAGALTKVYSDVDRLLLGKAVAGIKNGLVNPAADPNCAVGAATADPGDDCGIQQAVAFFKSSIPTLVDGVTSSIASELLANIAVPSGGCDPANPTLVCGAGQLADGGKQLTDGTRQLLAGAGKLDDGGSQLASKLGELTTGLGRIDDGAGRLSDGAGRLSAGLGDAATGSGKIAEGLHQAAGGAPKLVAGAQKLSDKGTSKLVAAGVDTAQNYGQLFATIKAGAERASTEDMAFGAPKGAAGLTAYSYVINGDDGATGRNWARGVGGLAVLGAGAGAFALRRRRLA
ncbi:MAG: hypothetical protein ACXVXE_07305 [Nocardioidaceae bacterium]